MESSYVCIIADKHGVRHCPKGRERRVRNTCPQVQWPGVEGCFFAGCQPPANVTLSELSAELRYPHSSVFETARLDPEEYYSYLLLPLQLLNLNDPIRVAQLKLPVVA